MLLLFAAGETTGSACSICKPGSWSPGGSVQPCEWQPLLLYTQHGVICGTPCLIREVLSLRQDVAQWFLCSLQLAVIIGIPCLRNVLCVNCLLSTACSDTMLLVGCLLQASRAASATAALKARPQGTSACRTTLAQQAQTTGTETPQEPSHWLTVFAAQGMGRLPVQASAGAAHRGRSPRAVPWTIACRVVSVSRRVKALPAGRTAGPCRRHALSASGRRRMPCRRRCVSAIAVLGVGVIK